MTFLLVGVGMFLGSKGGGQMMERFPAAVPNMAAALGDTSGKEPGRCRRGTIPTRRPAHGDTSTFGDRRQPGARRAEAGGPAGHGATFDANRDGRITLTEVEAASESVFEFGGQKYQRDELVTVVEKIAVADDKVGRRIRSA